MSPPSTQSVGEARPVTRVAAAGNVVMLDRYRERRALEDALRKAARDLTPPTTAG